MATGACIAPRTSYGVSSTVSQLLQEKQQKIQALEKCEGKRKGFMIAGISTIGLTGVGVVGNVALANANKRTEAELTSQKQTLATKKQELADRKKELENKKSQSKKSNETKSDQSDPGGTFNCRYQAIPQNIQEEKEDWVLHPVGKDGVLFCGAYGNNGCAVGTIIAHPGGIVFRCEEYGWRYTSFADIPDCSIKDPKVLFEKNRSVQDLYFYAEGGDEFEAYVFVEDFDADSPVIKRACMSPYSDPEFEKYARTCSHSGGAFMISDDNRVVREICKCQELPKKDEYECKTDSLHGCYVKETEARYQDCEIICGGIQIQWEAEYYYEYSIPVLQPVPRGSNCHMTCKDNVTSDFTIEDFCEAEADDSLPPWKKG